MKTVVFYAKQAIKIIIIIYKIVSVVLPWVAVRVITEKNIKRIKMEFH